MIILLATTMHVHASELQHQLNQIESGTLVVSHQDEDGSYEAISPLSTDVRIDISGLLARAQVKPFATRVITGSRLYMLFRYQMSRE